MADQNRDQAPAGTLYTQQPPIQQQPTALTYPPQDPQSYAINEWPQSYPTYDSQTYLPQGPLPDLPQEFQPQESETFLEPEPKHFMYLLYMSFGALIFCNVFSGALALWKSHNLKELWRQGEYEKARKNVRWTKVFLGLSVVLFVIAHVCIILVLSEVR